MSRQSRSGLSEFNDRALEWLCAGIMVSWGLTLALDGDAMVRPPPCLGGRPGMTAALWASILCGSGLVRVAALYINGRWPKTPVIRTVCASLGLLAWSHLSWAFAEAAARPAAGIGVYGMLALAELFSIYRAAHDARYHHV